MDFIKQNLKLKIHIQRQEKGLAELKIENTSKKTFKVIQAILIMIN